MNDEKMLLWLSREEVSTMIKGLICAYDRMTSERDLYDTMKCTAEANLRDAKKQLEAADESMREAITENATLMEERDSARDELARLKEKIASLEEREH